MLPVEPRTSSRERCAQQKATDKVAMIEGPRVAGRKQKHGGERGRGEDA